MLRAVRPERLPVFTAIALCVLTLPNPARSEAQTTLAMLPIRMLDTSGEPRDQRAEHGERLVAMAEALSAHLAGRYRIVGIPAAALDRACPDQAPACILSTAREGGARLAFVGVIHKSSTLIMQMFARVVDTDSGATLFSRELNFRGDNAESWRRAEVFLARQFEADPPRER